MDSEGYTSNYQTRPLKRGSRWKNFLLHAVLILYSAIVAYPMLWLLLASLKSSRELFESPWGLPSPPQWGNFAKAWVEAGIGRYFLNSVFVTVVSMFFILLIGSMAAYALARFAFPGRGVIQSAFTSGMMFPVFLGIVPLFLLLRNLGMWDNYFGLITAYVAYSLSFTVFILTGFFKQLPNELAEAGLIDGCSHFAVFRKIMLPLAKPGLITAGIFNFFGIWNEYPLALVIIATDSLRTLPLGIANLLMVQHYETDWGALFAGLVIVMLPTLIVYLIFQRQITERLTAGALKG
ncbi:MAG: carbohydrate ABC transporter permease [Armatimonadetes bacterium]|nr:carbohydrate ABC transporter permease [Armatimonadota bacterium]